MGKAKRNPWGFLPLKPFPLANSSTGCTPLAFGERRFTRGYIPLPHPGQTRKDRKRPLHETERLRPTDEEIPAQRNATECRYGMLFALNYGQEAVLFGFMSTSRSES